MRGSWKVIPMVAKLGRQIGGVLIGGALLVCGIVPYRGDCCHADGFGMV